MQSICSAASAGSKERRQNQRADRREKREERKWAPTRIAAFLQCPVATSKKFRKSEGATEMATSSNHCIFTVSRGHLDEGRKNTNELARVSFAKVLKSRGCHEEGRKLDSLHIYDVPWPRRREQKRAEKKASKLRSFFEEAVFRDEVARECPAEGRQPDRLHIYDAPCDGQIDCIFAGWEASGRHNPL